MIEGGAEYPKSIYRDGGSELIWGKPVETGAVSSHEEEMEALSNGWRLHPIAGDEEITATIIDGEQKPRRGRPPKVKVEDGNG